MAKQNTVFKNAYNRYLQSLRKGMNLPTEPEIAAELGIGRSTVRVILDQFQQRGLILWNKKQKTVLRDPAPDDFFPEDQTSSLHDIIEKNFMQMILSTEAGPGLQINEL